MTPCERWRRLGGAGWLLGSLAACAPEGWDGRTPIFLGVAFTDEHLAEALGVRPRTITAWCKKLHRSGLLRWLRDRGTAGRYFVLQGLESLLPTVEPAERKATETQIESEAPDVAATPQRQWLN